ncbi:hypothetical protein BaRGS_00016409 [Batillaria attramentaria]|uniref:Tyr recombinase domain-containing protein n=1 Tax=Batillaria attramentaria TaxID=370345 RepID=A0ABD0KZW3_9CAEN
MFALAFHAFLRVGEITVSNNNVPNPNLLQREQLVLREQFLSLTFHVFKHSTGQPFTLKVEAGTQAADCPVTLMAQYLSRHGSTPGPLFTGTQNLPVSRSQFNEQLRRALAFCKLNTSLFKSHSFRIGAATTAAAKGLSDSQIRQLGRWRSDAFKRSSECTDLTPGIPPTIALSYPGRTTTKPESPTCQTLCLEVSRIPKTFIRLLRRTARQTEPVQLCLKTLRGTFTLVQSFLNGGLSTPFFVHAEPTCSTTAYLAPSPQTISCPYGCVKLHVSLTGLDI